MLKSFLTKFVVAILFLSLANNGFAETVELITYYPTASNQGNVTVGELRADMGSFGYGAAVTPNDGDLLVSGSLGVGLPEASGSDPTPVLGGVLDVRGEAGEQDYVLFKADLSTNSGLNVGIAATGAQFGTDTTNNAHLFPQAPLHIVSPTFGGDDITDLQLRLTNPNKATADRMTGITFENRDNTGTFGTPIYSAIYTRKKSVDAVQMLFSVGNTANSMVLDDNGFVGVGLPFGVSPLNPFEAAHNILGGEGIEHLQISTTSPDPEATNDRKSGVLFRVWGEDPNNTSDDFEMYSGIYARKIAKDNIRLHIDVLGRRTGSNATEEHGTVMTMSRLGNVRIKDPQDTGSASFNPDQRSAPNGLVGNLNVNDVYLRSQGQWASQIMQPTPVAKLRLVGTQSIPISTNTEVNFDTRVIENGNIVADTTNNRVQIQEDGLYRVTVYWHYFGPGKDISGWSGIKINGSIVSWFGGTAETALRAYGEGFGSEVFSLSAGDRIKMLIYQNATDPFTAGGNSGDNKTWMQPRMTVEKIG